jgi:hypothetical protein
VMTCADVHDQLRVLWHRWPSRRRR